jgi:hypothetical protein
MEHVNPIAAIALAAAAALFAAPSDLRAHCDTMDGPVIKDAREALAAGDAAPALKWVKPEGEATLREAFRHAVAVRALGGEARDLADRFFFETLVRIHREGEGAPYTGLKPAGKEIEPAITAADEALRTGSVDTLARMLAAGIEQGLRQRFDRAAAARKQAAESVEHGRRYVAAYVDFVHYAERLGADAGASGHAGHDAPSETTHRH